MTTGTVRRWGRAALAAIAVCATAEGAIGQDAKPPAPARAALEPPVLRDFVQASYPPDAEKRGLEAVVILSLDIDASGRVIAATVIDPAGNGFDEAALAAARAFVFSPARRGGTPIPSRITYRYTFSLKEKPAAKDAAPSKDAAPRTLLRGRVDVGGTTVPLAGARVRIVGAGTSTEVTTGEDGTWKVPDLPPGTYRVTTSAPGYEELAVDEDVEAGKLTEVVYRLQVPRGADEVVVRGDRPPREVTKRTIEQRELTRIPGTNGDALRALENLPGVARPPAFIGFLIVRGSAPTETEIYVDGSFIPLAYHFGGLSSVFPSEMLERLDFYPGNFGVKYGRVTGAIVDMGIRSPKDDGQYHGVAQLDLIDARIMAEGPVPFLKGVTFLAGARRSHVDTWLGPALEASGAGVTTAPVYYDYQAFLETRPTPRTRVRAGVYGSDDRLEILIKQPLSADPIIGGTIGFRTAFWRAQAEVKHELSDDTRATAMLSYGLDRLRFSVGGLFLDLTDHPVTSRLELSHRITKGVTINVGQDVLWMPYEIAINAPPPPRSGEPDPGPFVARRPLVFQGTDTIYRPGAYAELELAPHERLRLVPGFRADYAKDTKRWDASPRLSGRYVVAAAYPKTTLKGGVGIFHQPPQPEDTNVVFGTPGLHSATAVHYALGVEQELSRNVEVSVEPFYKQLDRLDTRVSRPDGASEIVDVGAGHVVGVESLLRYKPDGRFFGWIAYTLSRSMRRATPSDPLVLFEFDQTHILTMLGSYRLGRGWEFGARFRYTSGRLDTPCQGGIFDSAAGAYACQSGPTFSRRLPAFNQLDLRIDKTWLYDSGVKLSAYLDLLNVYNRRNVEGVSYNYDYSRSTYAGGLPILPSLGVRVEM